MARDYKNRGRNQPKKTVRKPAARTRQQPSPSLPLWRWGLVLIAIAVFGGFLFWLNGARQPVHEFTTEKVPVQLPDEKLSPRVEQKKEAVANKNKPIEEEPGTQYKFYQYLPQKEVVLPEPEISTRKREEALGKAKPGRYILQVGSFRNYEEADRLKAKLALLGIEVSIEKAEVGEKTWNRVRSGPYTSLTEVDKVRKILRQNNIDAAVLNQSS